MKAVRFFFVAVLSLSFAACTASYDGELYPFRENGEWGYISPSGEVVVKPQFADAGRFVGDYAVVALDSARFESLFGKSDVWSVKEGWLAVVNKRGKILKNVGPYRSVTLTPDGYAIGCEGALVGDRPCLTLLRIKDGSYPIPVLYKFSKLADRIEFETMEQLQSDGALVYRDASSGLFGMMAPNGEVTAEPRFSMMSGLFDGFASACDSETGKCFLVDKTGTNVMGKEFDSIVFPVGGGLYTVSTEDGYCLIDSKGEEVSSARFDDVVGGFGDDGLLFIKKVVDGDLRYALVDTAGRTVIGPYDELGYCEDGMISYGVQENAGFKAGYLDKDGNVAISPRFCHASSFSEGLAWAKVSEDGKYGYIDKTGEFVIQPAFDSADAFTKHGLAVVRIGDLYGVIDRTGQFVLRPEYSYVDISDSGMILFTVDGLLRDGKMGYANAQGDIVYKEK